MAKKITLKDIRRLEKELEKEEAKVINSKRAVFLKATINRYSKELGLDIEYSWL